MSVGASSSATAWMRAWRCAAFVVLTAVVAAGRLRPRLRCRSPFRTPPSRIRRPRSSTRTSPLAEAAPAGEFQSQPGFHLGSIGRVFLNDPPPATDNITNLDGNQAAYVFGDQGMGLYQTLGSTYQVGASYQMTVGIVGQGGGMPDGAILQLVFYYLDAGGNMVPIATTTALENSVNFSQSYDGVRLHRHRSGRERERRLGQQAHRHRDRFSARTIRAPGRLLGRR